MNAQDVIRVALSTVAKARQPRGFFSRLRALPALAWALIFLALLPYAPAIAAQSNAWSPTTGTVSGLALTTNYNNAFSALLSSNSGSSAPANDQTALAVKGQFWLDTSVTPNALRYYDGASWTVVGYLDTTNHRWLPPIGGGTDTIASATTTDLGSKTATYLTVSGVTTITGFGSSAVTGTMKALTFSGAMLLTHSSPGLILPNNAANITTVVGDTAWAVATGSGNWTVVGYVRGDGTALNASASFNGAVSFNGAISPANLTSNTNDWAPAGIATANTIRFSCNASIVISGITAPAVDGKIVLLDNVGSTNGCTFSSQDTNSTAGNRFAFNQPIVVPPLSQLAVRYDLTTARWKLLTPMVTQPVAAAGFSNLRVFNVATFMGDSAPATPATMMTIKADALTVRDVNGNTRQLTTVSCTIDFTGNSFSSGSGGLDTSSLAAPNWYATYVIYNPTTGVTSCLGSLQATYAAATQPSGFTFAVRVGWNRYMLDNALTELRRIVQYGSDAWYAPVAATNTPTFPTIGTTSGTGLTALTITAYIPTTSSLFRGYLGNTANSNLALASNTQATTAFAVTPSPCMSSGSTAGGLFCDIPPVASTVQAAASSGTGTLFARGWKDNL